MAWLTPTERTLILSGLRPLLLLALVLFRVEPFTTAGVALVESILIAAILAVVTPYEDPATPPEDVRVDLDGFSARWPARYGLREELPMNLGFSSGLWAGLGAIPVLFVGIQVATRSSPDPTVLVFFSAVLAAPVAVAQLVATSSARWVVNRLRRGGVTTIDLSGRTLTVNQQRWLRSHTDDVIRQPRMLRLRAGERSLEVTGGEGCIDWLAARLDETRPPPEDAAVPASLQALRQSPQRSST